MGSDQPWGGLVSVPQPSPTIKVTLGSREVAHVERIDGVEAIIIGAGRVPAGQGRGRVP